ncbi:Tyrosyl-tRNA synthetase [Giardia muris]|uniref:tyrosine--tRNA ligase n=1 Tax=Giardia muris TaxID=5742 RepID=A0A4Z1T6L0_GIAMU|nr:Tyrosyl-tRNA synthetase [Giardia muris]|eukprot:TNJ29703.1 Tyrosyl-tRNA synthetase [Giardia muris]
MFPVLSAEEKEALLTRLTEEIIEPAELHEAVTEASNGTRVLSCYDGFEPSGRIHIAQGIVKAINTNRLLRSGVSCIFYVADWYALLNNKCDADLTKIQVLGRYFIEVWRASGMLGIAEPVRFDDGSEASVKFIWASDFIRENSTHYWTKVMDISRRFNVPRIQRCSTIMGRTEGETQPIAQILYPAMQCADVFELGIDLVEMGVDQRKVNTLARDYCDKVPALRADKPVILLHHMLLGLVGGKMSKSIAGSAIYMDDPFEDIQQKVLAADCPSPKELVEEDNNKNPILEYYQYVIFGALEQGLIRSLPSDINGLPIPHASLTSAASTGGQYESFEALEKAYMAEELTPDILKTSLIHYLDDLISPIRTHFSSTEELRRLLADVHALRGK